MGKFVINFSNVCAIDDIEISQDSVKTPFSATSRPVDGSRSKFTSDGSDSEVISNADANKNKTLLREIGESEQKQHCVNRNSGGISSPDIITIKINLKKNHNSLMEKNVTSRKKLRLVFEEEDTERNVVDGDVDGEIKEHQKKRVGNGLYDQCMADEIIGEEQEAKIKNRKNKNKKITHSSDNDEKNDLKDDDHDINIENSNAVFCRVDEKEDADCTESNVNNIEDQNVGDENCKINRAVSEVIGSASSTVSSRDSNRRSVKGVPRIVRRVAPPKHPKYRCPDCGMLKGNLQRHYQHRHPQVSKEEMILRIGGTPRQLRNAQQQKITCPICHLSFTNLKIHIWRKHKDSVNNLNLEKPSLVASNAKKSPRENTTTVMPETVQMPIVKEFMEYMLDEQKGAVEEATAKSYAAHVKNILEFYLPPDGEFTNDVCANFSNLDDKNGFFEHAMKTMTPVMMYHYFDALRRFWYFIEQEKKYWWFDDSNNLSIYRLNILRLWSMSAIMMNKSEVK